jgi:hypothetical protein
MAIVTDQQEYKRLRSYLNPALKGKNVDAVLSALATASGYLVNSIAAVNDNLFIATASGQYLDVRLAEFGITRPASVGLSDDVFREIGLQVKNRKQVRDLLNNILEAVFGDEFVKATNPARAIEPYALQDGDTLIINFDGNTNVTVPFSAAEFQNIAAAKAQEVADAITTYLSSQGMDATAISKNNGTGNYVEIVSGTIGPASSVTVLGGRAQNALLFDAPVSAGGNMSTQWTLSLQPGGKVRFTWTGGANPQLGKVSPGNYVNIFGGGFTASSNVGSYTIVDSKGGTVGNSYFEIVNVLGTPGIITQGSDQAVLFYDPIKKILSSNFSYAAIYQTEARTLQIFLPAVTRVIRRGRAGSAHIHDAPRGTFTLNAQPNSGDTFSITTTASLIAGTNFTIGANILATTQNLVAAINQISGIVAEVNSANIASFQNNSLSNTLTVTYTGSANVVASGPLGDPTSLQPNQPGPYVYDTKQPFVVGSISTKLAQNLNGNSSRVVLVDDSTGFPNAQGYIIFDYGSNNQEGPVPYIAVPSSNSILISPAYTIQNDHSIGGDVRLISLKSPVILAADGSDYEFFLTDIVSGRTYAQNLIQEVAATGINVIFTILYPNDIGLGKWGTQYSEISKIYGE